MQPEVHEVGSLLHLTYNSPGRVHTIKPYPLLAPNGSSVLFLGQENGLQVLWHGGRTPRDHSERRQRNGDNNPGESLELDSDDETDDSTSNNQNTYLESDEDEYDPSKPFERIVQSVDLPFGTAVLEIAFPPLPTDSLQRNLGALPPLFTKKLVAAVICSDASVRLVTLPVAPPSWSRKRKAAASPKPCVADGRIGPYGEQITTVTGGSDHQAVPRCISLTLAPSSIDDDSDIEMKEDGMQSARSASRNRRRQTSRSRSKSQSLGGDEGWDILVASSSSDLTGLLLIHRIPLAADGNSLGLTAGHTVPWSVQHLPSPAASIQFNPSLPQDERNSILLVAEAKGPVRILNCLPTETAGQCTWLVTLLPNYQSSACGRTLRKHVLDAQWVQCGKAILVLLADGEWGVWDLFDAQPKALSGSRARQADKVGSFLTFAISGSVSASPRLSHSDSQERTIKGGGGKAGKLAPMTPGTRRVRQENLFSGPVQQSEGPARGGISTLGSQDAKVVDEAVSLWHNDNITVIPSLRTHWANKIKESGNLFGNGAKGEPRTIGNISLRGERRNGVVLLPQKPRPSKHKSSSEIEESVLVLAETRFVLVTSPLREPQATRKNPSAVPLSDQRLLERGHLTLEGMDRVLATMDDRSAPSPLAMNGVPAKRKVGFLDI
ncbi:MAG: hypothetical protein Q9178_006492 [Gyalolechia marmorata]